MTWRGQVYAAERQLALELETLMPKKMVHFALLGLLVAAVAGGAQIAGQAQSSNPAPGMPVFEVDPSWPKIPNSWVLGIVSSVTVDKRDHVWIFHRPESVPENLRSRSAPPVLEYDASGKFLNAWGGPAAGHDWPVTEHGITVDVDKNTIWLGGSGVSDDFLLKYDLRGNFVKEFFAKGISKGNADTNALNRPSDAFIYAKTNEVFISDGYGNRRVIVLDADTGAFRRMWGAFGNPPDSNPPAGGFGGGGGAGRGAGREAGGARDGGGRQAGGGQGGQAAARAAFPQEGPGPDTFGNPVHAIKISNDGLLYVADRANRRIQIFTPEGKYVTQVFINRAITSQGTAAGIAFSPDKEQTFMYVSDLGNSHMLVLDRKKLEVLYEFGPVGTKAGEFRMPHQISVDSKGNLYVAEVNPGNRAQKFVYKGMSKTAPANALTASQLSASAQ
jgi:hypothetical protein